MTMQQMAWAGHLVPSPVPEVAAALRHTASSGFSIPQFHGTPGTAAHLKVLDTCEATEWGQVLCSVC